MKIIEQSVKELNNPSYKSMLEKIETAGRTCYQSQSKGNPEKFIKMIINNGHESVLEHASLSFVIRTNRNITHEIVRHRLASYSQESTRYVAYKNDIEFIPSFEDKTYYDFLENAEKQYKQMLQNSVRPEIARDILPGCLATTIVVTMNIRELRHFLKLRMFKGAHPQIRELSVKIFKIIKDKYPVFASDLEIIFLE